MEDDAVDFVEVRDNGDMDNTVDAFAGVDAFNVVVFCNIGRFVDVWKDSSSSFIVGGGDKFCLFFFFVRILFFDMVDDPLYDLIESRNSFHEVEKYHTSFMLLW